MVIDKGPLRHGLGVQGLLVEGGGHLPPDHPGQVLRHGHLHHLLPVPYPQQSVRIGGGLSRIFVGLSRVIVRDRPGRRWGFCRPQQSPAEQQHRQQKPRRPVTHVHPSCGFLFSICKGSHRQNRNLCPVFAPCRGIFFLGKE